MSKIPKRKLKIETFSSIDEENTQEYERRRNMTPEERLREFAILQERQWGAGWSERPIVRKVSFEKLR